MDGDQSKLESGYTREYSSTALLRFALVASWLLVLLWPLPLLIENSIGLSLIARKSPLLRWLLCFSSTTVILVCTILLTVGGYFTGTAKYITLSEDQPDAIGTFSPRYRCDNWWFPGDIGMGWMWLISVPNTLTFRACYTLFGPMPHTYHGPLPSMGEIRAFINSPTRQPIALTQFKSGGFTVAGINVHLNANLVETILDGTKCRDREEPIGFADNVIYTELYMSKCLVFIVPAESASYVGAPNTYWIVSLVDPCTGKLIAQELLDSHVNG